MSESQPKTKTKRRVKRTPEATPVVHEGWKVATLDRATLVRADAIEWLDAQPENLVHAVVTDPPYGIKEYEPDQLAQRKSGRTGIWRLPPAFGGAKRQALPRFTALTPNERKTIRRFFTQWSQSLMRVMRPGAYAFVAGNAFLSQLVFSAIVDGGLEFRGELIRLVRTLRGGDRPKGGEKDYPNTSTLPRGLYEPWGIFRKPLPEGKTVRWCLKHWGTGGLRRISPETPFEDVIVSQRTPKEERAIAEHPSLKPQQFLRQLVRAALPMKKGLILDTFAGSGSTLAAAQAMGFDSIGIERDPTYFLLASTAIPGLAGIKTSVDEAARRQRTRRRSVP